MRMPHFIEKLRAKKQKAMTPEEAKHKEVVMHDAKILGNGIKEASWTDPNKGMSAHS